MHAWPNARRLTLVGIALYCFLGCLPVGATAQTQSPPPRPTPKVEIVYITKTGEKYHKTECRSLAKSKIEIPLTEAKKRGYTECGICYRKR